MTKFLSTAVMTAFRGSHSAGAMTARQRAEVQTTVIDIIPPARSPVLLNSEKLATSLIKRLFETAFYHARIGGNWRFGAQSFCRYAELDDGTLVAIFECRRGIRYVWAVDEQTMDFVNLGPINE